jgi:hypothetical protein
MKNLITTLGIAGMIALSSISYAQGSRYMQKINVKDVPVPRPEQLVTITFFEPINSYALIYDTDGDKFGDLQFLYRVMKTEKGKKSTKFFNDKPWLLTVDLNRDHEITDDEIFEIDYTNSQFTNPLERKPKIQKFDIEPQIIFPDNSEKKQV